MLLGHLHPFAMSKKFHGIPFDVQKHRPNGGILPLPLFRLPYRSGPGAAYRNSVSCCRLLIEALGELDATLPVPRRSGISYPQ